MKDVEVLDRRLVLVRLLPGEGVAVEADATGVRLVLELFRCDGVAPNPGQPEDPRAVPVLVGHGHATVALDVATMALNATQGFGQAFC